MKKTLVLTGMMGVGKSTVGNLLSSKIGLRFRDVDAIIEKKLSLSVKEIFDNKGEKFFRDIEEKQTIELLKINNFILALGGGAFLNSRIREMIKKYSISIWLDLSIKRLFERTKRNDKRPLLNNIKTKQELETLYKQREKFYSLADYKIDCNFKTKSEIADEIKKIYENNKN